MIMAAVVGALAYIFGTGLTVTSAWLITMASQHPPILVLGVAVTMVRFYGIARSVARYAERVVSHRAVFSRLSQLRSQLFSSAVQLLRTRHIDIGSFSKSLIDDVERAEEFHLRITLPYVMALISGIASLLLGYWIHPSLLWTLLPSFLIFALAIPALTRRWIDPVTAVIENYENQYAQEISHASSALVEARIFGYRDEYLQSLHGFEERLSRIEKSLARRITVMQSAAVLAIGGTLIAVAIQFAGHTDHAQVTIAMALFIPLVAYEGFTLWIPNLLVAGKNRRAAQNVHKNSEMEFQEIPELSANDVQSFAVKNFSAFWSTPFAHQVSFSLRRGEIAEINGESGAGKSTLAAAVLGFAQYEGEIVIDGVAINHEVDRSAAMVGTLQYGHIFNTTLRENLKIANQSASDEVLRTLLDKLHLENIELDQLCGQFGRALSGGELKRIATARVLLSDAPIFILDEPLEHLNKELAADVASVIADYASRKILIVITHSPWPNSDVKVSLHRQ